MQRMLAWLDQSKRTITTLLVVGLVVATGLWALHSTRLKQLLTLDSASADESALKDLAAKQQAIMAQLASIKIDQPAGFSANGSAASATDTSPNASSPSRSVSASSATSSSSAGGTVHLNSADEAALETLPDIGASKAQAILDYRTAHGPFKSIDELDDVKGIGAATIDKLRPHLTLD